MGKKATEKKLSSSKPRFMRAIEQTQEVMERFGEYHATTFSGLAQEIDFILSQPQLVGTASHQNAIKAFREAVEASDAPEEIADIYRELYSEVFESTSEE